MSLATEYVELRAGNLTKPCSWTKFSHENFLADNIDMNHLRKAFYSDDGRTVVFADGSVARKTQNSRKSPWIVLS